MQKIIFFLCGILVGGLSVYWFIGYHTIDVPREIGFASYIQGDIAEKYKNTKTSVSDFVEGFANLKKSKDIIYNALIANIQHALVVYYEAEGEFPASLDAVISQSALPKDIKFEYKKTSKGYTLRILDAKTGSLIQEILGSGEGV